MDSLKLIGIAAAVLSLGACGGEEVETDRPFVPAPGSIPPVASGPIPEVAQQYHPDLNVVLPAMTVLPSGVRYFDTTVGTGVVAVAGHRIQTRYRGWLPSGEEFDSGLYPAPGGAPLILGTRAVIRGWDEGIVGMRVGGLRQLVVPPEMGYGNSGSGSIPGGATLVFMVELLSAGN